MTRLTQLILATRSDEVQVATFSESSKYGFLLELGEYHRVLVSSVPIYGDATAAETAGQNVIDECVKELSR